MAYSEELADRVRRALADLSPDIVGKEKRMFGGLAFMVDDKMCISVRDNRIMCRIDPALHNQVITKPGCVSVMMGGREYKGYVYVSGENLKIQKDLDYWVELALNFNKRAKASKRSGKSK